jgi:cellulose synthase (UDP-forming)
MAQRIAYAATILGWFDAWRTLGYVLLPVAVLFSGAMPIKASILVFATAFGVTFALQRLAMALLSRGYAPQGMAALFEFVRMQSNLRATLTYFRSGERPFKVTSKQGTEERRRVQVPWMLWSLLGLTAVAWCGLDARSPASHRLPTRSGGRCMAPSFGLF